MKSTLNFDAHSDSEHNDRAGLYELLEIRGGQNKMFFKKLDVLQFRSLKWEKLQVFDGDSTGIKLYQGPDFTEADPTNFMLSADSGEMQIRFKTDASKNARGFSAVFSADCPPLQAGEGV